MNQGQKWAQRTTCLKGHPYTPENTYHRMYGMQGRKCRICKRAEQREYKRRRRERERS